MSIEISTTATVTISSTPKLTKVWLLGMPGDMQTCEVIIPELGAVDVLATPPNLDGFEIGDTTDLQTITGESGFLDLKSFKVSENPERFKIFVQ